MLFGDTTKISRFHLGLILPQPGGLHIGFLHKKGVEVKNPTLIPGTEGAYLTGRRAISVDVKMGKFSAHLLGVHLKSGRDKPEQMLRDTQCVAIGNYLTTLRNTPGFMRKTLLLMGDFNMIPGQDVSNFHHLGGDDLMDFVSSWDLQDRFSHILEKGRANLLDGFAVSWTYATDYVRGSLSLFPLDHGYGPRAVQKGGVGSPAVCGQFSGVLGRPCRFRASGAAILARRRRLELYEAPTKQLTHGG